MEKELRLIPQSICMQRLQKKEKKGQDHLQNNLHILHHDVLLNNTVSFCFKKKDINTQKYFQTVKRQ